MSRALLSERDQGAVVEALAALTRCKRALHEGRVEAAGDELRAFRASAIGQTARQFESDLLELRITALRDAASLVALASAFCPRHVGRQNQDAYLSGAAELIRRHKGAHEALTWLERAADPATYLASGRGRTAALYLSLLRQAGRLDEARVLAGRLLDGNRPGNPHVHLWEQTILTLRGQRSDQQNDLRGRIESVATNLPLIQRLRLSNAASAGRVLVASASAVGGDATDELKPVRLELAFHRMQATLSAREQKYALAAEHLAQARELSLQLHGECLETLELALQRFEVSLLGGLTTPTDRGWLESLRSVAEKVGFPNYLEYRLANVWRKAGQWTLAYDQYAWMAKQYPTDRYGIRAAYQLAVAEEEGANFDSAYNSYLRVANTPETKPSVAMLCLVGAFRCAMKQNDDTGKKVLVEAMRDFGPRISDMRQVLIAVRQLRDDGLGALSDALLDECRKRYESTKGALNAHKYLELTHHLVRRLYSARRYEELLALIDGLGASYWDNAKIHWEHLAGCLHYGCLAWLELGDARKAVAFADSTIAALSTRPAQSAHVELALARAYQQSGGWAWAQDIYHRIVANAPFSRAAMKARVQLAKRAWDTGAVAVARQWAMSALIDGKVNRKDPDLDEAYWSAYSMAASKQDAITDADGLVYPSVSSDEAMERLRRTRVARQHHMD